MNIPDFTNRPFPLPDPNDFDADTWHPADFNRGFGHTDYSAGPTRCFIDWLHNKNTRPAFTEADASESERYGDFGFGVPGPWASTVYAYKRLPDPQAVESIILGHIPCICEVIKNWVSLVFKRNVTQSDDEYYSMALGTLCGIVPSLRKVGQKHGWEDWDVPGHIAPYLGKSVRNMLFKDLNRQRKVHEGIIMYLLLERSRPRRIPGLDLRVDRWDDLYRASLPALRWKKKKERETKGKKQRSSRPEVRSMAGGPMVYAAYDDRTPDRILIETEEADKPRKSFSDVLDSVCEDIYDRLLLGMRAAQVLTETEMGKLYGGEQNALGRDPVNRRFKRMHENLQMELGHDPKICTAHRPKKGIRCSRKGNKRQLAEEVLAAWRDPSQAPQSTSGPAARSVVPAPHFLIHPASENLPFESLADLSSHG